MTDDLDPHVPVDFYDISSHRFLLPTRGRLEVEIVLKCVGHGHCLPTWLTSAAPVPPHHSHAITFISHPAAARHMQRHMRMVGGSKHKGHVGRWHGWARALCHPLFRRPDDTQKHERVGRVWEIERNCHLAGDEVFMFAMLSLLHIHLHLHLHMSSKC